MPNLRPGRERSQPRILHLATSLLLLAAACGAETIADHVVARVALTSNSSGALEQTLCLSTRPAEQCPPYPNPLECEKLDIDVLADGRTLGRCRRADGLALAPDTLELALPINCDVEDSGCVACRDTHGELIVDACGGRQTVLVPQVTMVREAVQRLARRGLRPPTLQSQSPSGQGAASCVERTRQIFTDTMNAVLQAEGLNFSFQPSVPPPARRSSKGEAICTSIRRTGLLTRCDGSATRTGTGNCYCFPSTRTLRAARYPLATRALPKTTCRCDRMVNRVLEAACEAGVPPDCSSEFGWYWLHFRGQMHRWLWQVVGARGYGVDRGKIQCLGSPLVLDQNDDGIKTTTPSTGVRFDLVGHGAVRTAWLAGTDDAFLAMDRNENGRIDGGQELFGEASGGLYGGDGFSALAQLDQPNRGGDGDGWITANDALFGQLLLWQDTNHDGQSQREELTPLAASDIAALGTRVTRQTTALDAQGNDLGTRGLFRRHNGRMGSLVDVYFRAGATSARPTGGQRSK